MWDRPGTVSADDWSSSGTSPTVIHVTVGGRHQARSRKLKTHLPAAGGVTQVSRHPHPSPLAGGHRGGLNDGRVDAEVAVGLLWNQSATCLSALDQVCYLGDVLIAHSQSAAVVGDVAASWVSSGARRRCCAWPARCSSRPTTNGKSPTNATYPRPPWRYSIPATNHSRTLPRQRLSPHSENLQSLRPGPDKRTTMGGP